MTIEEFIFSFLGAMILFGAIELLIDLVRDIVKDIIEKRKK